MVGHVQLAGFILDGSVLVIACSLDHPTTQLINELTEDVFSFDIAAHAGRFAMRNQGSCAFEDTETAGAPLQE